MSRLVVYVPSNFTVAKNTVITFENCMLYKRDVLMPTPNVYKKHFEGDVTLSNVDIFVEDEKIVFIDKIEAYTGAMEERLV